MSIFATITWLLFIISPLSPKQYKNSMDLILIVLLHIVSWPTVVKGDRKAPFSIATTPRYRQGGYSSPWIAPLTHDPYLIIVLSIKYFFFFFFKVFGMTWPGIEPWSPQPLVNTLAIIFQNKFYLEMLKMITNCLFTGIFSHVNFNCFLLSLSFFGHLDNKNKA